MKSISTSNQRKIGAVLSYGHVFLTILTGLIYTPFMIHCLGKSEYGLYGTINSAVSMLSILDLGFTSSYIRFYTKYTKSKEYDKLNGFNSLFFMVFAVISGISLAVGLFFSFNLDLIFDKGLTDTEYSKARIMMIMLTFSMAIQFLLTIYGCVIFAKEKHIISRSLNLFTTLFTTLLGVAALLMGKGAVGVVLVTVICAVARKLIEMIYSVKKLDIHFDHKSIENGLFKQVFVFSGLIAINSFVDKINSGLDSVILGRFCGTAAVAVYTVGNALYSHFMVFSGAVSGVFTPHVYNLVNNFKMDSKEQRQALTKFFTKVGRIQYYILALLASGIVFFGKKFILYWAGEGYDDAYIIAVLLIVSSIPPLIQNVGIEIQRAENRHHYRSYIYAFMAIFNLIISIILCKKYEGIGCALGTAFAMIVANTVIMNIVYHKKINVDVIYFWKSILRQTLGMILPFAVGALIMMFADIDGFVKLAVYIVVYSLIYAVCVYFLSMNEYEKGLINGVINKLKRKKV